MSERRPFRKAAEVFKASAEELALLSDKDWLEAFAAHPKIGESNTPPKGHGDTKTWALNEQSGVQSAPVNTLKALEEENSRYESKFGYIFIVCATGKSASEMLGLLRQRIENTPVAELSIATSEQAKITQLRLEKLMR